MNKRQFLRQAKLLKQKHRLTGEESRDMLAMQLGYASGAQALRELEKKKGAN